MSYLSIPTRRVSRVSAPGAKHAYQVFQLEADGSWSSQSKEYEHSTSAFAALGRLYQKDVLKSIEQGDVVDLDAETLQAAAMLDDMYASDDGYTILDITLIHVGEDYATVSIHWSNGEIFEVETSKLLALALATFNLIPYREAK